MVDKERKRKYLEIAVANTLIGATECNKGSYELVLDRSIIIRDFILHWYSLLHIDVQGDNNPSIIALPSFFELQVRDAIKGDHHSAKRK